MKKLPAIFLITLFLFNLVGYRMIFDFVQRQSDVKLEASLDKDDFNEAELISIKVPLSLPYQNNQQNFERVNGELKVDGKLYKYVKRKIENGNLILLCLPDHEKMKLQSAKDEFFKYANDLVQNNNSKKSDHSKSGIFKNLIGEYDCFTDIIQTNFSQVLAQFSGTAPVDFLPSSPHGSPEQPPEVV